MVRPVGRPADQAEARVVAPPLDERNDRIVVRPVDSPQEVGQGARSMTGPGGRGRLTTRTQIAPKARIPTMLVFLRPVFNTGCWAAVASRAGRALHGRLAAHRTSLQRQSRSQCSGTLFKPHLCSALRDALHMHVDVHQSVCRACPHASCMSSLRFLSLSYSADRLGRRRMEGRRAGGAERSGARAGSPSCSSPECPCRLVPACVSNEHLRSYFRLRAAHTHTHTTASHLPLHATLRTSPVPQSTPRPTSWPLLPHLPVPTSGLRSRTARQASMRCSGRTTPSGLRGRSAS